MLSSLKEKILSVSLFNTTDEKQPCKKAEINLNAGAEILQHFQNQWEELHKINEENAKNAEKAAHEIERISAKINANKTNLELIEHIFTNSKLADNISRCLNAINDLYRSSEKIEHDLIKLETLMDEGDFQRLQRQHKYHLDQYQIRKEESLETFKSNLNEKHTKKIADYDASKKIVLEERQKVFQDAFKTDLEMYKSMGTIPEISHSKKQNGALLEEIQLDFDQNELDQFFNDN
ncbi:hypothetical protein JTB14_025087 [Gonioctena quinquepunctata]|nr:hypothetical protein JTB14_025087 [Gonioctena quinquepunctata]